MKEKSEKQNYCLSQTNYICPAVSLIAQMGCKFWEPLNGTNQRCRHFDGECCNCPEAILESVEDPHYCS